MKTVFSVLSGAVAVLALAVTPALAQGDRGPHGGGSAGGGGGAAPGAGGGGVAAASSGGGGGSASGGGMSSGGGYSGGGGSTSGGFSSGGATASSGGASPMGGGARPVGARGARSGGPESGAAAVRAGEARNAMAADPRNASIPGGSRPNYGNPAIGSAVPRGSNTGGGGGTGGYPTYPDSGNTYWGYPYGGGWYGAAYSPWFSSYYLRYGLPYYYSAYDPFYMYGYGGFGLGSLYYDPFWFGGMSGGGGASSIYYGRSPLSGGDIASAGGASPVTGWSMGGYSSSSGKTSTGVKGGLKLKVAPKDAEVYVDGTFMGRADQYNGPFQRLDLPIGAHRIELRAKGYNNVSFEVKIEPRDIQSYHGTMQPLQPAK